ncbi:MBL fold metallo-hydrolase [Desulfobacca acetoxidans]|nr:MBL fold metallo-hydrolase [Desulfobacterales bacterium]
MLIRCYGARGSIPVSGPEYIRYGGDTTCLEIRSQDGDIIIVDAGSGIRRLGKNLMAAERFDYTLFMTHSHWDHILGFPFFKPIYDPRTRITILGCNRTQGDIKNLLAAAMRTPFFPVPFSALEAEINYNDECVWSHHIGPLEVFPISLSHPNGGLGYKFVEAGKTFVFLTDNELGYQHRGGLHPREYTEFAFNADLLIHDAEYTPEEYQQTRRWGHSTYLEALDLAMQARVKRFGLFHHNQDRTDSGIDNLLEHCREIIAAQKSSLEVFALAQTSEILL